MDNNPAKSKYYERKLLKEIKPYFNSREIITIVGSRQVGKTTLLEIIFKHVSKLKKCRFLTFENRSDLEIFDNDIESFKKLYVLPNEAVFIDEFQYGKDAGQKLKYLFDTTSTKFFITGSSSLETKEVGKYLVGRILAFYLGPFSFSEYLQAKDSELFSIFERSFTSVYQLLKGEGADLKSLPQSKTLKGKIKDHFEKYIIFGGFPRVVVAKEEEEKKLILRNILDTYLLREIRSLLHLATENKLLTLSRFLGLSMGSLLSFNELGNSTGLSYEEIKKHLQILQETFIVHLAYPYYTNRRTELVKNPKVYFTDNGFRNNIIDNFVAPLQRSDTGSLVENFVFNCLKETSVLQPRVNFWRTKSQAEVDFVVDFGEGIIPLEVKYSPMGRKVIGKSMYSFIAKYSPKRAYITTNDDFGKRIVDKCTIYFIPVYYLL